MPHATTLSVIAGLAVAGAAAGVGLGRATLAEVPAAYFQSHDESQFYGDLAPNHRADWAQVQAAEYQQQASAPPPATAAVAAAWPVDVRPMRDPAIDRALAQAWREARAPVREPALRDEVRYVQTVVYEEPQEDPGRARIRRYSRFPVTREEAAPPPDRPDRADAAAEGDAATQ